MHLLPGDLDHSEKLFIIHTSNPSLAFQIRLAAKSRSSTLEVFLGKDVLKICSKHAGEHPC